MPTCITFSAPETSKIILGKTTTKQSTDRKKFEHNCTFVVKTRLLIIMLTYLGRAVFIRHFFTKIYKKEIKIKLLGRADVTRGKY
jgi:hypothetical protein